MKLPGMSSVQLKMVKSSWYQLSSVEGGIYELKNAHNRSATSLGSFPGVLADTVPMHGWGWGGGGEAGGGVLAGWVA